MRRELQVLRDVVSRLKTADIDYMLTGSFALIYYAEPRMTRDIDLVVSLAGNDGDTIVQSFESDYYLDSQAVSRAIANRSLFNIIHSEHVLKVDFIVRKDTEYERVKFDRRQVATVDGIDLWIISKEDLIISKLQWARGSHSKFQLRDVKNLLATGFDADYVRKWTNELQITELLNECLQ